MGSPWDIGLLGFLILLSRVLIVASSGVNGNDRLSADTTLAHWADHCVAWLVHPHVNAGPAVQMATLTDDGLLGCVEADITLEHGWLAVVRVRTSRGGRSCRSFGLLLGSRHRLFTIDLRGGRGSRSR